MNFRVIFPEDRISPFYFKTKKEAVAFMATRTEVVRLQRGCCGEWSTWNGKYYEPSSYCFNYRV